MRIPRILYLEEDRDSGLLLARALERAGLDLELIIVEHADAFVAALDEGGVDLVLSDRSVSRYDSLAALRDLRLRRAEIPFVIMSGSGTAEDVRTHLAAGAAGFLLKDDLPRVADTLRRLLRLTRVAAPSHDGHSPADVVTSLAGAVTQLCHAGSVADVTAIVPPAAMRIGGADGASIAMRDGDSCRHLDGVGLFPRLAGEGRPLGDSVGGRAIRDGRITVVADTQVTGRSSILGERSAGCRAALAIPVGRGFPAAAIAVYWSEPHTPSPHDLDLLGALSDVMARALERIEPPAGRHEVRAAPTDGPVPLTEWEAVARDVSHDLRNPLWQIRGFAEVLRDDHGLALGDEGRTVVDHILESAAKLERVIDGLVNRAEILERPGRRT